MSNRLRVQRRTATSVPAVHDDSRVDAKEVQPPASPAPAPALAHDFATLDIASQDQLASLADPEVQRTHLRIQPREPRFQWGARLSVQRSTEDLGQPSSSADLGQRIRAAQGGGSSLEPTVQERLESGLGADLSGVRVHTDGEAAQLSQAVSATAFTTGSHIFFQAGAYRPHSGEGMHMLAHEAAHTIQQARGPVSGTPGPGGVSISDPSDNFEQAAETAAQRVVSGNGESPAVQLSAGGHPASGAVPIQRQPDFLKVEKEPPPAPEVGGPVAEGSVVEPPVAGGAAPAVEPPVAGEAAPKAEPEPEPEVFSDEPTPPPARVRAGERSLTLAGIEMTPDAMGYPLKPVRRGALKPEERESRWAKLPPGVAQQGKYRTKELIEEYRGAGERAAPEKWVGGRYVGQMGELHEKGGRAVKYLTEKERASYEIRLNQSNLFYWRGKVFNTKPMRSAVVNRPQGRAIFVMTQSGKIYAADEGQETRAGGKDKEARWRFNHSSFLAGEPVAAAGELVFDKGGLVGITDVSGHYQPGLNEMRQVVQEFRAQGVDMSGVWVLLSEKGLSKKTTGNWYIKAEWLVPPSAWAAYDEGQFRDDEIGTKNQPN